ADYESDTGHGAVKRADELYSRAYWGVLLCRYGERWLQTDKEGTFSGRDIAVGVSTSEGMRANVCYVTESQIASAKVVHMTQAGTSNDPSRPSDDPPYGRSKATRIQQEALPSNRAYR
ncbi:hypothetical protein K523DRAFT_401214, partial [Schizophyllum commune Tattone D]